MSAFFRQFLKSVVLLEAGAAIIFFGSLMHRSNLDVCGAQALQELARWGYRIPTVSDPVRIYPAMTGASLSGSHAGGWRPGVISLREHPLGAISPEIYLRHELMHEAGFLTCSGKLPVWAEEAAAISFSGELDGQSFDGLPRSDELDLLRRKVRIGAPLDPKTYRVLSGLVAAYGWPRKPCAVSGEIEALLKSPPGPGETGFSFILVSLASGRVLDAGGDLDTRHPPGSLLKIVYAAALTQGSPDEIAAELAASDTPRLLARKDYFDPNRYGLLLSPVKGVPFGEDLLRPDTGSKDDRTWRQFLGDRSEDGTFPVEASLRELSWVLRAALLSKPDLFAGLARNGSVEGTTLYAEPAEYKRVLQTLHALAKTGSVADPRGNPLVGHLMVAWPAEDPGYLAVFRGIGLGGAANLQRASRILEEWASRFSTDVCRVRVRLLSRVARSSWELVDECPGYTVEMGEGMRRRVSVCGRFGILASARGSRTERFVSGIVESYVDGQKVVLVTDPETYADGVLFAEARDLRGEAAKALRAVIVWNGAHGGWRHEDTSSVCDTTHCMVYQGNPPGKAPHAPSGGTDPALLRMLSELAESRGEAWLPFSKGGTGTWQRSFPSSELSQLLNEPAVLDILRERSRSGEVLIHLFYPEGEETVPCEVLRNRLRLLSCPQAVKRDSGTGAWIFEGLGEGHGQGMSLESAGALGAGGSSAEAILDAGYR